MVKRDKRGRIVCRVDGIKSDRIFAMRLTQKEFDLVMRARRDGHDPRRILLDQLRSRLESKKYAKT